jgi:hypothetical protein
MDSVNNEGECRDQGCGCGPASRRDFIRVIGRTATSLAAGGRMPIMAGPFEEDNDFLQTIPRDKRLAKGWVASLAARGVKAIETDPKALAHIGMPVGGVRRDSLPRRRRAALALGHLQPRPGRHPTAA